MQTEGARLRALTSARMSVRLPRSTARSAPDRIPRSKLDINPKSAAEALRSAVDHAT
jgi:hypothetical protein